MESTIYYWKTKKIYKEGQDIWENRMEGKTFTAWKMGWQKNKTASLRSRTTVSVASGATFGMIQQERQNNIINILGGHSYAM